MQATSIQRRARMGFGLLGLVLVAACQRDPVAVSAVAVVDDGATRPAQAVRLLVHDLRANDLVAFGHHAVPAPLHAQLETAWVAGRTRWPLQELPFDQRLPGLMATLSAPGSETRLLQVFDQQFAGQATQIRGAAASLTTFGTQYLQGARGFSTDERQHDAQLVAAAGAWARSAPLADRARAQQAIARLAGAARVAGLASPADFQAAGMDGSLRRMGRFGAAFKQALLPYGVDLDASLDGMQVTLQRQTGERARVRMRYRLASSDIDALVSLQRVDGRWYLDDYLQHARQAVAPAPPAAR